jgi:hypothetical protein
MSRCNAHSASRVVATILFGTLAAASDNADVVVAAFAATRGYRRHLADLLDPPPGKYESFAEFRDAVAVPQSDSRGIEQSDAINDDKARPFIRELLDMVEPLETARDSWRSQSECEVAANDDHLPPATRETLRRAAAQLLAMRKLVIERSAEHWDRIRDRPDIRRAHE